MPISRQFEWLAIVTTSVILLAGAALASAQDDGASGYAGSAACAGCHADIAAQHAMHGHSYALNPVMGEAPAYPHGGVEAPPEGYTWDDIGFVIGGWAWRALFLDREGHFVAGEAAQYNFALRNERMAWDMIKAGWASRDPGETALHNCTRCHTTGYDPGAGYGDLSGAWFEAGVGCEACHGPGDAHAAAPGPWEGDASAACARCHTRETGDGSIPADGDFIADYAQYEELQASPHAALTCTACHDPHRSVVYTDEDAGGGLAALCVDCHADMPETVFHSYPGFACQECHMPPVVASGVRDPGRLWADMRTHLVRINADPDALQFSEDGETVMPYITVRYACGRCHGDRSAEGLANSSIDYHERRR